MTEKGQKTNKIVDSSYALDTNQMSEGLFTGVKGDYEYPFELILPKWLPSSMIFENADGAPVKFSLMYYLVAQLCTKRVQ